MVHPFLNLAALFVLQLIIVRGKTINLHCVITKTAETHRLDQTSPVIFKVFVPTDLLSGDQHTSASQKRQQLLNAATTLLCLKQKNPLHLIFQFPPPLLLCSLFLSFTFFFTKRYITVALSISCLVKLPWRADTRQRDAANLWCLKQRAPCQNFCQIGRKNNPREEFPPESNKMNK